MLQSATRKVKLGIAGVGLGSELVKMDETGTCVVTLAQNYFLS